jgi:hypothetical protein
MSFDFCSSCLKNLMCQKVSFVLACFEASAAPRPENPNSDEKDALFGTLNFSGTNYKNQKTSLEKFQINFCILFFCSFFTGHFYCCLLFLFFIEEQRRTVRHCIFTVPLHSGRINL